MLFGACRPRLSWQTRVLLNNAIPSVSSKKVAPGSDNSLIGKLKTESKKILKIQLFLIPVCALVMIFMFPTPSPEEEQRMWLEYEKNAGWKT
ncbi:unnamed protein product [Phytomonas sp. EM1]|nr:unnamed protein product [Phytomonas sp. EM1]|eukprot:CCW60689.1 unnamed protein product [Phytomonas sp. isolate EM1]